MFNKNCREICRNLSIQKYLRVKGLEDSKYVFQINLCKFRIKFRKSNHKYIKKYKFLATNLKKKHLFKKYKPEGTLHREKKIKSTFKMRFQFPCNILKNK